MYADGFCSLLPDVNYNSKKIKSLTIQLTHSGRATQIFVSKLTIIGSGNGLSPGHRQAIVWTNAGIVLMRPLGTNFSDILIEIITFLIKEMHFKVSSAKRRPFCLGLNVFTLLTSGIENGIFRAGSFMMTSSNGNIFRVTGYLCGEFTGPRWFPHTKASDAELWFFFDLRLNKRLSKQSWGWWFETLSPPLWRHCNVKNMVADVATNGCHQSW